MENFLINMAIVKVNWDISSKDILDNYLPLLGYAIKCCDGDVVALEDVEAKLSEIADFKIPRGPIITLLKRATKPTYGYIRKEERKYVKVHNKLSTLNYERLRDEQTRRFNALKITFRSFCIENYNIDVDENEVDNYFFDILYDIAPSIYKNLKVVNSDESKESQPEITRQYLVSSFVNNVVQNDPASFAALEAFVRGAMLTETFYYSSPEDIPKRFRKTMVFFDTVFILRLLGYCSDAYTTPCRELQEMLANMAVRMRCFRKTLKEIHGILFAAASRLKHGRLLPHRPGDVFDCFAQNRYSSSDVELVIAKLEDNLRKLGIYVKEHPSLEKALTVDEKKLDKYISDYIEKQSEKARNHDIDCLTSIFRLRKGIPQRYLESCKAIFVTTNSGLARASTKFFQNEYGRSDAPICMTDQVFATLVWLKAVKKVPDLPKERIVANCYAALNPSEELWQKYLKETEKLREQNSIGEHDYAVLIHSIEARRRLMDITLGDDNVLLEGTIKDVLNSAKSYYLAEAENRFQITEQKYSGLIRRLNGFLSDMSSRVSSIIYWSILLLWVVVLVGAFVKTSPEDIESLMRINKLPVNELIRGLAFLILVVFTVLNIVFGVRLSNFARRLSDRSSRFVVQRIEAKFFPEKSLPASNKVEDRETCAGEKQKTIR